MLDKTLEIQICAKLIKKIRLSTYQFHTTPHFHY